MAAGNTLIGSQSTAASLTDTNLEIVAGTASIIELDRVRVGQDTHKTSEQFTLQGQRVTTTGTGTSTTPLLDEPQSAALGSARIGTCKTAMSVEPSYTASTVYIQAKVNSLTGRDVVYPPGSRFYISPSALFGIAVITPSGTTTATYVCESHFFVIG